MRRITATLILAIALLGCAPEPTITVCQTLSFGQSQTETCVEMTHEEYHERTAP